MRQGNSMTTPSVQIGDKVRILPTHQGLFKGHVGEVLGFTTRNGYFVARVKIKNQYWAHVRPENLKVLPQKAG